MSPQMYWGSVKLPSCRALRPDGSVRAKLQAAQDRTATPWKNNIFENDKKKERKTTNDRLD
jgi:hypothetical protein